jgi:tRNA1Val (adenine37-N6)-methyltransferase
MFRFKHFTIEQELCAMKVGTDGVLLGAWAQGGRRVLDVGTGTGVVALMMAQRFPEARVTAIDVDEGAMQQAMENVSASPFKDRVEVLHASVQEYSRHPSPLTSLPSFDAVVSNPPYFIDALSAPDRQRHIARHADTLTYTELMTAAWRLLKDDGELSVIVPFDYRQRMEDEATFCGFFPSRVCAFRTKAGKAPKRFLLAFRKHPYSCERTEMTLGDELYRTLTQDFYL